eukprot:TRINITY_DN5023_c0_g3_i1.p1 TRINITY_DN5023_c0_g3~~TRINITY_DN5023_c0_g3_i1.p1  ORF type:complete len:177 (-),score=26.82 TRINITY_DN5023_c0_g3_i1:44-574(-)
MANYSGYGNFMWLNEYLHRTGHGDVAEAEYLAFAAAEALAVICMTLVIDKLERKHILAFTFIGAGSCTLGGVWVMDQHAELALALLCGYAFFEQAVWCVLYVYAGEVYPSTVRNTATGLAMGPTRIGGVVSTTLGRYLMNQDVNLPFYLTGTSLLLGFLLSLCLRPGKTGQGLDDF